MRTAGTAPLLFSADKLIRYIVLPLVMAIGLFGLIHHALTGEGTTDQFAPTSIEERVVR